MANGLRLNRRALGWTGMALAAVALLAVNLWAGSALKDVRLDLTADRLYTVSDAVRRMLAGIDEPITARLYFSKVLGERSPQHAAHYARIKGLLQRYADLSQGGLRVEPRDPEPFSEAEDQAVAFGLQGVPVTSSGDLGYFGLALTNSVDTREVVPFFAMEREKFVEYDLARMIHNLATPRKKTIGLISSLPMTGAGSSLPLAAAARPWAVVAQMREFLDVRTLPLEGEAIPADIDALMLVQPTSLSERMLYAIDQYALSGRPILAFIDPVAESEDGGGRFGMAAAGGGDLSAFVRLLAGWGVGFDPGRVAANIDAARRVNAGRTAKAVVADYVAWLSLTPETFDAADATLAGVRRLNLATAGVLDPSPDGPATVTPLITTSSRSMRVGADKVRFTPDVVELARQFRSEEQGLVLAARLGGTVKSLFPEGPPAGTGKEAAAAAAPAAHLVQSQKPLAAVVVADTDLLADMFWASAQDFFGQRILVPNADNADFVVNALESLSGGEALAGLRGHGRTDRPFILVETIRRDAEAAYRAKEQELLQRLTGIQARVKELERGQPNGGEVALTPDERAALGEFRRDMIATRRELRQVKHALAQDIERLDAVLKFVNIAGVPLLLFAVAALVALRRRQGNWGSAAQ